MDYYNEDYLMHYGIKGMKWGVRRYQNEDGSLTDRGKKRYSEEGENTKKKGLTDKQKTALKVGVAVAGTALAAYGAYKVNKYVKSTNADIGKKCVDAYMDKARKYSHERTWPYTERMYRVGTKFNNDYIERSLKIDSKLAGHRALETVTRNRDLDDIVKNTSFKDALKNVRDYKKGEDITKRYLKSYRGKDTYKATHDALTEMAVMLSPFRDVK